MALRKPDEPTRQGTYRTYGWLVALRPRFLMVATRTPGLSASLIAARGIALAAIGMPVTTAAILIGAAIEGQRFSLLWMAAGFLYGLYQALGVVGTIWALLIARVASWWWTRKYEEEIPWSFLTGLVTFTFVVWPVVTSSFGWIIPFIWAAEFGIGWANVPVRTWRLAWSFRRRWPMVFTIMDNTTTAVQASFGGGISAFFSKAKSLARPLLNHPALSPIMTFGRHGAISFWIHAPNGTTLEQARVLEQAIAEQYDYVASVRISVPPAGCSWARMDVNFVTEDDVLEGIEPAIEVELTLVTDDEDEAIELGEVA